MDKTRRWARAPGALPVLRPLAASVGRLGVVTGVAIVLGVEGSMIMLAIAMAVDAPQVLLLLPLACAAFLAGSATGLVLIESEDRWQFALFSLAALLHVGVLVALVQGRTGDFEGATLLALVALVVGIALRVLGECERRRQYSGS